MIRRTAAITLFALAAGCSVGRPRGPMSDAQRTYLAKCTACHSAYEPTDYSEAQWRALIDEMERRKRVRLSAEERALILAYLTGRAEPGQGR